MSETTLCDDISFSVDEGVARLELSRPEKRNAMTRVMWESLIWHLADAARDPSIRALVLQGSGAAFCAGADLGAVKEQDGSTALPYRRIAVEGIEAVAAFPAPTVARVEGACVGAGCSLALACDVRFVDVNATFSIPAVRHGIVYDQASISRLVALVGPSRSARMLYAAEPVDARTAVDIGLADECRDEISELVSRYLEAVVQGDPATIRATRTLVRATSRSR